MINLQIYDDEHTGRWGEQLFMAGRKVGFNCKLFTVLPQNFGEKQYIFAHIHNNQKWRTKEKEMLAHLGEMDNTVLIPDNRFATWYDDKIEQAKEFADWMPQTWIITKGLSDKQLDMFNQSYAYPLICKKPDGSGSKYVTLVHHYAGLQEAVKQGYTIVQTFLTDNKYDYRVCSVGDYVYVLKRYNRPDVPFASGSGLWEAINDKNKNAETDIVMGTAMQFFAQYRLPWCGIDLVYDKASDKWAILEVTIGWKMKAYYDCQLYRNDITYRQVRPIEKGAKLYGYHIWDVLCQEIAIGAFG